MKLNLFDERDSDEQPYIQVECVNFYNGTFPFNHAFILFLQDERAFCMKGQQETL